MAIVIERDIAAPASDVLAAIARAGEWRESAVPKELKKGAVIGIVAKIKGSDFRLHYVRKWYPGEGDLLELRGRVEATPNGGSRVVARCGYNRGLTGFMVGIGVIALLIAFTGGSGVTVLIGIAVVVATVTFIMNARAEHGMDHEAAYLVQRLEEALKPLARNRSVPAPAI